MTLPDPTPALRAVAPLPRRRSRARRASAYAQHTRVPIAHSQAEISRTLQRYGATWTGVGLKPDGSGAVAFVYDRRRFEAVKAKLLPFEAMFLPFLELPGLGQTVSAMLLPKIDTGELPALLAQNPEPR